jgi:drug/metabolite transporter (DMT)-like permease
VPVVGLASSWVILGEPLTVLDLLGAATTFVGIVLVSASAGSRDREPAEDAPVEALGADG